MVRSGPCGFHSGFRGAAVHRSAASRFTSRKQPESLRALSSAGTRLSFTLFIIALVKSSPSQSARVLGLDVGTRRIGMAVSDPLGITAQGIETLQRRNKRHDLAALESVIRQYDVQEIVVGLPLRMSGQEGTQSGKIQAFAEDLRKRFHLPIHLWDERLTSVEANRLLRETDLSIEKRAKAVDRMAAILILQAWMEHKRCSPAQVPAPED